MNFELKDSLSCFKNNIYCLKIFEKKSVPKMKMDILKMSKIEKLNKVLKKTCRSQDVTRMLSFSKNGEKKCDDNFFFKIWTFFPKQ